MRHDAGVELANDRIWRINCLPISLELRSPIPKGGAHDIVLIRNTVALEAHMSLEGVSLA